MSERGEALITVAVFIIGTVVMFCIIVMSVSNTQDDISKVAVQSLVAEFVYTEASKGKVTQSDYNAFLEKLDATGNTYEVQLEHKIMSTNPNKGEKDKAGENRHYSVFNTGILDNGINKAGGNGEYLMEKGDYFGATVKNTNTTIATQFMNAIFKMVGRDNYVIAASAYALVPNTGSYSK